MQAYIRFDSREYMPHGVNTFTLMKHKRINTSLSRSLATFCRNSSVAFDFLEYHVHIRHRRDYDKQKVVVMA